MGNKIKGLKVFESCANEENDKNISNLREILEGRKRAKYR